MIINYSDQEVITGKKSIFLAGPTPRGEDVISWRNEACLILKEVGFDGIVYVPEYSSWKPKADYVDQAEWERKALTSATVIVFLLPRDLKQLPAFTSNVEFGYWLHSGKVLYGRPDNASKVKYLDWLYKEDTGMDAFNDLTSLLLEATMFSDKSYDGKTMEILPLSDRKILSKTNI